MTERTFEGLWADLAPVGRDKHSGGYRRFAWSREDSTLREWFDGECEALGLDVVEVNVEVNDVHLPSDDKHEEESRVS